MFWGGHILPFTLIADEFGSLNTLKMIQRMRASGAGLVRGDQTWGAEGTAPVEEASNRVGGRWSGDIQQG